MTVSDSSTQHAGTAAVGKRGGVGAARPLCARVFSRLSVSQVSSGRASRQASGRISTRGFTLIEVLVAMTIIAVGVSALVASAGSSAWRADYLREREFGRWVASNRLTELQVLPDWPDVGTKNTEAMLGDFRWYVRTRTQKVSDDDLRRVDVEVRRDKDAENYIYAVSGFVGNPEIRQ